MREEGPADRRIVAWRVLKEAKALMDELRAESAGSGLAAKLDVWLPEIEAAAKDVSNLISDDDGLSHLPRVQQIAVKLNNLGQRKTSAIATLLARAADLMDGP